MFTSLKDQNFRNCFNPSQTQKALRGFALSLLPLLAAFLMGCTTFASTAVVLTTVANQSPENPQTIATNKVSDLPGPVLNHEPGKDVVITTTFWIHPFSYGHNHDHPQILPETAVPAVEPVAVVAAIPATFTAPPLDSNESAAPELPTIGDAPVVPVAPGEIAHVVIITIDGLRPDALEMANTPTLDGLRERGAYSPNAQTIIPSFTLPSHVSMLTGVAPQDHGIVEALPCIGCRLSIGPTLFNVAHDAGLSTGAVFGKEKLGYLVNDASVQPGSMDTMFSADAHDPEVKDAAVEMINESMPNLLFVHLPDVDRVGHEFGWMSENQLYAVNYADMMVGEIVAALEDGHYLDNTLVIITADHGGHGFKHGDDSPVDRTIPWLAVGPGVPSGVILNSPIATVDTAATAAHALDLTIPQRWIGQPVMEIFK